MTVSAISHYRGGTIDVVTPVARALKAAYLKHGISYRLSRFETGPNAGDWLVIVTCADKAAYEKAGPLLRKTPKYNRHSARLRSSQRGSVEKNFSISIFDARAEAENRPVPIH
jgi:hypothetical protein